MPSSNSSAAHDVPAWLSWALLFDTKDKSKRQQRKQIAINSFGFFNGCFTLFFTVFYLVYNLELWPLALIVGCLSVTGFTVPFVMRLGEIVTVSWVMFTGIVGLTLQVYLLSNASGIHYYFFIAPVSCLVVLGPSRRLALAIFTAISICCFLVSAYLFDTVALAAGNDPFLLNFVFVTAVMWTAILGSIGAFAAFSDAERAEDALEAEYARSESLLYNLLPEEIAARLKAEPDRTIADALPQVAILFADIVGFTERSAKMNAEDVVGLLNRVFSSFDELVERHGLEKVKTIGDAYMVAAGMPASVGDPVHSIASMALDMLDASRKLPDGIEIRIGIHAGPAVAGVIGNSKLFYDVWGETVNTASRMESHGAPGRIQVTNAAFEELKTDFHFEERGTVEVKGLGPIKTWWLNGKRLTA